MISQTATLASRSTSGRYIELDALRGLAALIVLMNHLALAFSYEKPHPLLRPFLSGHEAVVLFFVLSGFVLSLPFWNKGSIGPYLPYLVRRFFRIYVPFAAACTLALTGAHFFVFAKLPLGWWFYNSWQTALTPRFLISQFLMAADGKLNTAFWSLRYEVQFSILLPALLLLLGHWRRSWSLSLTIALNIFGRWATAHLPDPYWIFESLEYTPIFLFGALLARDREPIRRAWEKLPRKVRLTVLPLAFILFFYGGVARVGRYPGPGRICGDLAVSLGACSLVLLASLVHPLERALRSAVPEYLGRISYSLYLTHGTVLFVFLNLLYGKVPLAAFLALTVATVLVVSHLFCVLVEEPSLKCGKRVSGALR
jgi:peptidoglycan/LPS O-acetylase OafA/YrhL